MESEESGSQSSVPVTATTMATSESIEIENREADEKSIPHQPVILEPVPEPEPAVIDIDTNFLDPAPYVRRRLYINEMRTMWNFSKIMSRLGTEEQCIAFAEEQGLIKSSKECPIHRTAMILVKSGKLGRFVCRKGTCQNRNRYFHRAAQTWFEKIKISLPHVFYLMYCFAHGKTQGDVIFEDPFHENEQYLSPNTIADWYNYCREVISIYQIDKEDHVGKIGGPGKIVQIDESKFGKRKYNRGHQIGGQWVLGMIEDGSEDLRLEICPENCRSSDVIIPLIQKHVAEGTTIHTDYWQAYDSLSDYGFIHHKVNHSDRDNPFIAPDGTHTQRIMAQWGCVKRFFNKYNYKHSDTFGDILYEYLWKRNCIRHKKDPFMELVYAIKHVYPPP